MTSDILTKYKPIDRKEIEEYLTKKRGKIESYLSAFWFLVILTVFVILEFILVFFSFKIFSKGTFKEKITNFKDSILEKLDKRQVNTISPLEIISLSYRNMKMKKSRVAITVGGMILGIGTIVLLVSIGYGLQELVTNRVTNLEEVKQVNVTTQIGSNLKLNSKVVSNIKEMSDAQFVIPIIESIGKIELNGSQIDTAVIGVQSSYFDKSSIKPVTGTSFVNDELDTLNKSKVIPSKKTTDSNTPVTTPSVQGVEDQKASTNLDWVEVPSEIEVIKQEEEVQYILGGDTKREVVVNRAALRVLGLAEDSSLGKKINVQLITTQGQVDDLGTKNISEQTSYKIVGVTPDDKTPVIYIPIVDLKSLGVSNYSQLKVGAVTDKALVELRKKIESIGFNTASVADTINQINTLFGTIRFILGIFGSIALAVAALGLFNTLTVSLLERTREIGLMKAMGMRSYEIERVFLTESMIVGLFGGLIGLIVGFAIGKFIGLVLTLVSLDKGLGFIDVAFIPADFVFIVLILSLFVGVITGIYPARRAKKISALNALRYE